MRPHGDGRVVATLGRALSLRARLAARSLPVPLLPFLPQPLVLGVLADGDVAVVEDAGGLGLNGVGREREDGVIRGVRAAALVVGVAAGAGSAHVPVPASHVHTDEVAGRLVGAEPFDQRGGQPLGYLGRAEPSERHQVALERLGRERALLALRHPVAFELRPVVDLASSSSYSNAGVGIGAPVGSIASDVESGEAQATYQGGRGLA